MARLQWGDIDPTYEFGVDHGVLYPTRNSKVAWHGLLSVMETPVLNDPDPVYFEGKKINIPSKPADFSAAVSAFTYPEELEDTKDIYAMSFRTYKEDEKVSLHIIYNPVFTPESVDYESFGSGIDPIKFSWTITNRSSYLKNHAPSGHFIIEFYNVPPNFVSDIEDILYDAASTFPTPQELVDDFEELQLHSTLLIIDHGNGMWTAIGPDDMINLLDETSFEITSPTAIPGGEYWYTIESF